MIVERDYDCPYSYINNKNNVPDNTVVEDDIVLYYKNNVVLFRASWDTCNASCSWWVEGIIFWPLNTIILLDPTGQDYKTYKIKCGKKQEQYMVSETIYNDLKELLEKTQEIIEPLKVQKKLNAVSFLEV